jgi:hypothetical protein
VAKIVAFGTAVNALILTAVGFADLSSLGIEDLPTAIAALAVSIVAVVVAVLAASRVPRAGQLSLTDLKGRAPRLQGLRDELERNLICFRATPALTNSRAP